MGTVVTTPPYDLMVSAPTISSGYIQTFYQNVQALFFIKLRGVGVLKNNKSTECNSSKTLALSASL